MAATTEAPRGELTQLVAGIVNDAQTLIREQLTLFQVEVKNDLKRTTNAAIPLSAGMLVCLVCIFCLATTLALVLGELAGLPLWAGFAIVTALLAVTGGGLILWGKFRFDAFNPLPDESVEGLKETIQWKTKP